MKLLLFFLLMLIIVACAEDTSVLIKYYPVQCEETIWEKSDMQYQLEDTEIITDFYALKNIKIRVEKNQRQDMVCMACGCPNSYYYVAQVKEKDLPIMIKDGWVFT